MLSADCLVLLSNIDGLYTKDPKSQNGKLITEIKEIDEDIISMAGKESHQGSGGMITKIEAAKICMSAGCNMVISSGNNDNPILSIERGQNCSWFYPSQISKNSLKIWLSGQLKPSGKIYTDEGASSALLAGKSLLAAGVIKIEGTFDKGDTLVIYNISKKLQNKLFKKQLYEHIERIFNSEPYVYNEIINNTIKLILNSILLEKLKIN